MFSFSHTTLLQVDYVRILVTFMRLLIVHDARIEYSINIYNLNTYILHFIHIVMSTTKLDFERKKKID